MQLYLCICRIRSHLHFLLCVLDNLLVIHWWPKNKPTRIFFIPFPPVEQVLKAAKHLRLLCLHFELLSYLEKFFYSTLPLYI